MAHYLVQFFLEVSFLQSGELYAMMPLSTASINQVMAGIAVTSPEIEHLRLPQLQVLQ